MQTVEPLADRVLVERKVVEDKLKSGIYIPSDSIEKPVEGTVVAVGPGILFEGKRIPLSVKKGDTVVFGKYAGTELPLNEKEYLVMREDDLLGVLKNN